MSETQVLLAKITALRQRLEQAQGLANEAKSAAAALLEGPAPLDAQVEAGAEHDHLLDAALRPLTDSLMGPTAADRRLSARARRVLERGGELLARLRPLADDLPPSGGDPEPLALLYRDTVALLDTVLRTVPLLPGSTTAQLPLCQGLEVALNVVAARLRALAAGAERRRREADRAGHLADLLTALEQGRPIDAAPFLAVADEILAEAQECAPLHFPGHAGGDPAAWVAAHGLTVARVVARVVRHDPELRGRARDAVLAALLHDAGMLRVPADAWLREGPLDDAARRAVEGHTQAGAELLAALAPESPWLAEAALAHHERLDGTGYPDGLGDGRVRPLPRLLGVCDVYAAQCSARPHRPARPTRTALADTLLLAEQGGLDRHYAECLLHLSFYPVGSAVELADGAVGVVVATPGPGRDLSAPARPVVAVLTDAQGRPLDRPRHLDLAQTDAYSIVRSLSPGERTALARACPEWAA